MRYDPSLSDLIDGSIGEESPFEQFFGYYPKGVSLDTAVLPSGWQERVIEIRNANTNWNSGYCLEPHDLAISKLVAGREKDKAFVQEMLICGMVKKKTLLAYLDVLAVGVEVKKRLMVWIASTTTAAYSGEYRL